MRNLRLDLATRLVKIEDLLKRCGIPMSNVTLIARSPDNDNMFVCLTNEDYPGLKKACALALNVREEEKP